MLLKIIIIHKCLVGTIVSEKLQITERSTGVATIFKISLSTVAAVGMAEAITFNRRALTTFSDVKHALHILIMLYYVA